MQNPNYNLPSTTRSFTAKSLPTRASSRGVTASAFGLSTSNAARAKTKRQLVKEYNLKKLKDGFKDSPFSGIKGVNPFDESYESPAPKKAYIAQSLPFGNKHIPVTAAAKGFRGVVKQPRYFLVGEAGPEKVNVIPMKGKQKQPQPRNTNRFTDSALPGNRLMNAKLPGGRMPRY